MVKEELDEIKKLLKTKKLIIGTERTIKGLKLGNMTKIFLSSNCPETVEEDISHYAKIAGAAIVKLNIPNDELGVLCKKQFSISVLGLIK